MTGTINDECSDDRKIAITKMYELITGLSLRFAPAEEFLSQETLDQILKMNQSVLPEIKFERNWGDHFLLIDALVEANNKSNGELLTVRHERMANIGSKLFTKMSEDIEVSTETCNPPFHPFPVIVAANVKHQFRDLSIHLHPTEWNGRTSETKILMQ